MGEPGGGPPPASQLRVVRWKQPGHDRLHVSTPDDTTVGWLDLTDGTEVVEIEHLRAEFVRVIDAYLLHGDTDRTPTSPTLATVAAGPEPSPDAPPAADAAPSRSPSRSPGADPRSPARRRRTFGQGAPRQSEQRRMRTTVLDLLPTGWHTFDEFGMPGSRAKIDHVVVGPAGVFTIESRNYLDQIVIANGRAKAGGHPLDWVVAQANRQRKAITHVTGAPAVPIIAVHGKGMTVKGWFQEPILDGVRFCPGSRLVRELTSLLPTMTEDEVWQAVDALRRR